LIYLLTILMY